MRGSNGPSTTSPIGLTFFLCTGYEANFQDCRHGYSDFNAAHENDIGISCQPGTVTSHYDLVFKSSGFVQIIRLTLIIL